MKRTVAAGVLAALLVLLMPLPATAEVAGHGPPDMATGSVTKMYGGLYPGTTEFKASGTPEEGKGFIHFETLGIWFDYDVDAFCKLTDTRAAFSGVLVATNHPGWPVGLTRMVMWVEDNGEGANSTGPDKTVGVYSGYPEGGLMYYSPSWLCGWGWMDSDGVWHDAVPEPIYSGNVQVH